MKAKIDKIRISKLDVPLKEPFVISLGTIYHAHNVVVQITDSQGRVGTGEACPYAYIVGETQASVLEQAQHLAPLLIGLAPTAIVAAHQRMNQALFTNPTVKSAFDMALYDLAAQQAELPLYAFLGGTKREDLSTGMTLSIGKPDAVAEAAKAFVAAGYTQLKLKLGTTAEQDIATVAAVRQAVGDEISLKADANQGWDVPTAREVLNQLPHYKLSYCEEPLRHDLRQQQAWLRQQVATPIMADETLFSPADALQLVQQQAADYFNIKLSKSGGIYPALAIGAVAAAAGIKCQIGCMSESKLATTALAHLCCALPSVQYFDMDAPLMLTADPVEGGIGYGSGFSISLPEGNGLGATVAEAALEEVAVVQ